MARTASAQLSINVSSPELLGSTLRFSDGSTLFIPSQSAAGNPIYVSDTGTGWMLGGPGYNSTINNSLPSRPGADVIWYVQRGHYNIFIDQYTKGFLISMGPSGFTGYPPLPPNYYQPPYG